MKFVGNDIFFFNFINLRKGRNNFNIIQRRFRQNPQVYCCCFFC
jgi:hypothetical protein